MSGDACSARRQVASCLRGKYMSSVTSEYQSSAESRFADYDTAGFYDEMFDDNGIPRPPAKFLAARLKSLSEGELQRRQKAADQSLLNMGITFNVYGHQHGTEKIWPFDLIPRVLG